MTFGRAFDYINRQTIKLGMRLTKWSVDVIVEVQFPDENSKMTAPYLYVESKHGRVPWIVNEIELFDDNWEVVEIVATREYI